MATLLRVDAPHEAPKSAVAYKRSHHYPELDALRGFAAFAVVLGHFLRLWDNSALSPTARILLNKVFLIFFNGSASVILFFLLSGFVLSLPFKRGSEPPYGTFVLRRLARIYLPYFGALLLAIGANWYFFHPMHVSVWFGKTWTAPINWPRIFQNVLLIGNYDTAQFNTAFWSLAVEMRLSLLFPLICIPLLRWNRSIAITALGAIALLQIAIRHFLPHRLDPISFGNLDDMMIGLLSFAGGILLARWLEPAQGLWARIHTLQRVLLFVVSLFFLEWLDLLGWSHFWVAKDFLTITGGCGILIVTLCSRRVSLVLNHRLPAWLGRISYSLYLVHATVLFTLVHVFFGRLTRLQIFVPYVGGALAVAAVFYFLIERPSIRLSRSIGRSARPLSATS